MRIEPPLAERLDVLLQKLLDGKTLAVAAAEAGIGAAEVVGITRKFKKELAEIAKKHPTKKTNANQKLALVAYADGGSRGNPGRAACAAVITDASGAELLRRARLIGKATNNVAEYEAVRLALVRQLEGQYKVKNADLLKRYDDVRALISGFHAFRAEHIPRAQNALADKLLNAALDGKDLEQA
jgi:ribonuclease HI